MFHLSAFRDWSIGRKMTVLFIAMAFATALVIALMIGAFDFWGLKRGMVRDLSTLADALGRNSTAAITFRDADVARDVLQVLRAQPSISAACIYAEDGRPLAAYTRQSRDDFQPPPVEDEATRFSPERLVLFRRIVLKGETVGTVYIESDLDKLNRRIREYSAAIGLAFLITLAMAFPLASGLKRPISAPVSSLVETAKAVSCASDYSLRVRLTRRDEFGQLVSAFNAMLDQIESRDQELRRHREHLEEEVANRTTELRQAKEDYRSIFEDAIVGIFQSGVDWRPIRANAALASMFGYASPEHFIFETPDIREVIFVDSLKTLEVRRALDQHGIVRSVQLQIRCRGGGAKWVLANVRTVRNSSGMLLRYEGTVEDINDRIVAENRVQFLAYYDLLTGLPNRVKLLDRLAESLENSRRTNTGTAVLFLDLDRFKIINDSLGHSTGDRILQEAGERLKQCIRDDDTVARIGGDEFLIVVSHLKGKQEVSTVAERVMHSMTREFEIDGRSLRVTCSVGISMYPEHGGDAETLIKNADAAMYSAKDHGSSTYRYFTDAMNAEVLERLTLENSLREAVDKQQFFLVYQPQINVETGRITGWEALLRWQHPELGLVPPDKFIRIAENSGLITPIGEWVLKNACRQMKSLQSRGLEAVPVAVNVSAVQFRESGLSAVVESALREAGLPANQLELELTESLLLSNADVMCSALNELQSMGVRLAIDDFGTGYSSLSYLRELPVGKLKIDRSFIRDITTSSDDASITKAIIQMARSLNLAVIAEGVETPEQLSFLRANGCDEAQGYLISVPLPEERMAEFVSGHEGTCSVRHREHSDERSVLLAG